MLVHTKYLVNLFHITVRTPPEILAMICSYLSTEWDAFSVSQVCRHWREVLTSFPPLWTHFTCRREFRTIAGLERCKSLPIRLEFGVYSLNVALESVVLYGNEIISLTGDHDHHWMPPLHRIFTSPMPYLERLHIYSDRARGQEGEGLAAGSIWRDFLFLRELYVRDHPIPVGQFATPNLVHLVLEDAWEEQEVTTQSILDMLRGSPLLETALIAAHRARLQETSVDYSIASLPNLRSIELGRYEVHSRLIPYLRFPPTAAVGFRSMRGSDISEDNIPPGIMASLRHVLGGIDICTAILGVSSQSFGCLVRFEGVKGSLEITSGLSDSEVSSVLLGVLFSLAPHLDGVRELQITRCRIDPWLDVGRLGRVMPNLTSIYFFHCKQQEEVSMFRLLYGNGDRPLPPFPHLERLTALEPGPGLIEACRERKRCGVPLQTVVIGPESNPYTTEQIVELGEFVDDVRVEIPPGISERSVGKRILDTWSGLYLPPLVSSTRNLLFTGLTLFYRTRCAFWAHSSIVNSTTGRGPVSLLASKRSWMTRVSSYRKIGERSLPHLHPGRRIYPSRYFRT